jgi:hypothetical protein
MATLSRERRLGLGENLAGEVREPARAVHARARVLAVREEDDRGSVLAEHAAAPQVVS